MSAPCQIERDLRRAATIGVVVAAAVVLLRLAAWWLTRSLAVLADAIDPLLNLLAAVVTAAGVVAGRRPADEEHPFGHRKLEFVVVGFQGAMVLSGAVVVGYAAWWQTTSNVPVRPTTAAVGLFLVSIVVNAALGRYSLAVGVRHGSPALRAAGRHARFDSLVGLGVLANLCLVWAAGWSWLDPLVSAVLITVIVAGAARMLHRAVLGLTDSASPEVQERARRALEQCLGGELIGFHDVRCRDGGGSTFIDFHLQFSAGTSLDRAHAIGERTESVVEAAIGDADATAHLEPDSELRADRGHEVAVPTPREKARRRAAALSLVVAVTLAGIKFAAFALTGSAAVLSDALESLINVVAAGFAVFSVRLARRGSDPDHPYGHHKIEFVAAALEGGLIVLAAIGIVAAAAPRLWQEHVTSSLEAGAALLLVAGAVNGLLGWHLVRTGRRLRSLTLEADGRHVLSDVWTTVGVLLGLALVRLTGWQMLDPLVAMAVAAAIVVTGVKLLRRSLRGVLDSVDAPTRARAGEVLTSFQAAGRVLGWHQLRIRDAGATKFIDAHIQLPDGTSLAAAHDVAETVEETLAEALAPASVIVHAEPASELR